jgi:uncharacterized membrane protein
MMMHLMLASEKSALKGLLGALHPGMVHFPIAILAIGALFEGIQILKKRREPAGGTVALAYLAALTAIPAAVFGFSLADHEGAEGSLIDLHKWLGLSSTLASIAAAGCAIKARSCSGSLIGLRISLILGTVLVLSTGYIGGEMMKKDHLLKPLRALLGMTKAEKTTQSSEKTEKAPEQPPLKPSEPASDRVDFVKEIAPLIQNDCFKCHGGEKVKGKFKFNTKKDAFEGGESGKAIIPGKSSISKLYTSLIDPDEDVLMPPPKEKVRPGKEQIEKVKKWIEQGAEWPDGFEFKK